MNIYLYIYIIQVCIYTERDTYIIYIYMYIYIYLYVFLCSKCDSGPRIQKVSRACPDYKLDHMEYFRTHGLTWPVQEDQIPPYIDTSGMFPREAEVALFCCELWPCELEELEMEFLDINPVIPRIVDPCFDEDGA